MSRFQEKSCICGPNPPNGFEFEKVCESDMWDGVFDHIYKRHGKHYLSDTEHATRIFYCPVCGKHESEFDVRFIDDYDPEDFETIGAFKKKYPELNRGNNANL